MGSLLLCVLQEPASPQAASRFEETRERLLGLSRTALLELLRAKAPQAPAEHLLLARAAILARIADRDPGFAERVKRLLDLDLGRDLEALAQRVFLHVVRGQETAVAALRSDVERLLSEQGADGGWGNDVRTKKLVIERIVTTATVLEALAAADVTYPFKIQGALAYAAEYLPKEQNGDGSYGRSRSRGSGHGAATASVMSALHLLAAREQDPRRRIALLQAIERSERWMRANFRADRNPGDVAGVFLYIAALESLLARSWIRGFDEDSACDRVLQTLDTLKLAACGWNERGTAQDSGLSGPVQGPGGLKGSPGMPLLAWVAADVRDTSWATLFLIRATRPTPKEDALAAEVRLAVFATRRPGDAEVDHFVRRAKESSLAVVPALVAGLESDRVPVRRAASLALAALSTMDFGFDPLAPPARNRVAIAKWKEWAGVK